MMSCWRKEVCNGDEARAYSKIGVTMRRKKGDASHLSQKKIAQFPQHTDAWNGADLSVWTQWTAVLSRVMVKHAEDDTLLQ